MDFDKTIDYVVSNLKERNMYIPSRSKLSTLIKENNFYARGLATKKLNGYKNVDITGKEWYLNNEGVEELIELTKKVRHRRTKEEIELSNFNEKLRTTSVTRLTPNGIEIYNKPLFDDNIVEINEYNLEYLKTKSKYTGKAIEEIVNNIIEEDILKTFGNKEG